MTNQATAPHRTSAPMMVRMTAVVPFMVELFPRVMWMKAAPTLFPPVGRTIRLRIARTERNPTATHPKVAAAARATIDPLPRHRLPQSALPPHRGGGTTRERGGWGRRLHQPHNRRFLPPLWASSRAEGKIASVERF